jgi:predicted RNase H-like HicB family nuclease
VDAAGAAFCLSELLPAESSRPGSDYLADVVRKQAKGKAIARRLEAGAFDSHVRRGYDPEHQEARGVRKFTAVVEKCPDTGVYVGYVPGFRGAHSQGASLDELVENLREAIELMLEDGEPELETEFVGTQQIVVP